MRPFKNKVRPPEDFGVSEESWRNTFDAITDLVSVLDKDFRLIMVNRALAEFLGEKPEELIGRHCYELMHGSDSHWDGCPHEQMMKEKKAITVEVNDPFIGIPLLVTASPILDESGELIGSVHVARDISIAHKMRNDLADRNQQLEALNRLCREAISSQDFDNVVSTALTEILGVCAPDMVLCYIRSGDLLILRGVMPENKEYRNKNEHVGVCLCGLAAEKGVPVFSEDIHRDGRCSEEECKKAGIRSFAALPLLKEQNVIGVLGLASKSARNFGEEKEFLETLAGTVSVILQHALLIEKICEQTDLLEKKVKERTRELEGRNEELERFNKLFVDREFRIKELRDQVVRLEKQKAQSEGSS